MPKLKTTITGPRVHAVGYRPFLLSVAEGLDIDRIFADNLKRDGKEVVEVLIEGSSERIETFKEYVSERFPENAKVDRVEFSDYDGYIMGVESFYRYLTAGQLSKIASTGVSLLEITEGISKKQDGMLDKQDQMLDKQDGMLDKQDGMLDKQDQMLDKQDETIRVLKDEGEKTRESLTKHLTDDIADLRQEIAGIKATLARVLQKVEA